MLEATQRRQAVVKTIYWAVLLSDKSKRSLLETFKPNHKNIYGEHMTVLFNPSPEQDKMLEGELGKIKTLTVTDFNEDDKGQAVVISGYPRLDGGVQHITISCAEGTKPFYSNKLLDNRNQWKCVVKPLVLSGVVACFTNKGWDKGSEG